MAAKVQRIRENHKDSRGKLLLHVFLSSGHFVDCLHILGLQHLQVATGNGVANIVEIMQNAKYKGYFLRYFNFLEIFLLENLWESEIISTFAPDFKTGVFSRVAKWGRL